jgi:hypothetical protein
MAILGGIFFVGLGIYLLVAPHDWGEGEWMRYNSNTRKSTLHPAISGPLLILIGIGITIMGIAAAVQDSNEAQADSAAQAINSELSSAFSPIIESLRETAEANPGVMMTLTAGDRERANVPEETEVYYGLCNVNFPGNRFYIVVLNWNGGDYQRGFPDSVWGRCGGSPADYERLIDGGSQVWIALRPGSFNPDAQISGTEIAPTATNEFAQAAPTDNAIPTMTPLAAGN